MYWIFILKPFPQCKFVFPNRDGKINICWEKSEIRQQLWIIPWKSNSRNVTQGKDSKHCPKSHLIFSMFRDHSPKPSVYIDLGNIFTIYHNHLPPFSVNYSQSLSKLLTGYSDSIIFNKLCEYYIFYCLFSSLCVPKIRTPTFCTHVWSVLH